MAGARLPRVDGPDDADEDDGSRGSWTSCEKVIPLGERVQAYVWRRHLVNAASRLLLTESDDTDAAPMCVGFADIVGYTTRSRQHVSAPS